MEKIPEKIVLCFGKDQEPLCLDPSKRPLILIVANEKDPRHIDMVFSGTHYWAHQAYKAFQAWLDDQCAARLEKELPGLKTKLEEAIFKAEKQGGTA